jgi:hypothetical protein
MEKSMNTSIESFEMRFDGGTIKHLGVQMYSSLPPVIGELVSNAWDAGARRVYITIPIDHITDESVIIVEDDGCGMTTKEIQEKFLVVGRDRRKEENDAPTVVGATQRPIMGRKGIGKFSGFGIAQTIEIESATQQENSRFTMTYKDLEDKSADGKITFPKQDPSGTLKKGTRVTLRSIQKFKTRKISIPELRRGLARQYAIIGSAYEFQVFVNEQEILPEEWDLRKFLDKDIAGENIIIEYKNSEIKVGTGWVVSGWIGTVTKNGSQSQSVKPGVIILARGKMVQAPFLFNIESSQPTAFSYVVGEIHAEFVDTPAEDMIATSRTTLVWDTEANKELERWGQSELWKIEKIWARKRGEANLQKIENSSIYKKFLQESAGVTSTQLETAKKIIHEMVKKNPEREADELDGQIKFIVDFARFDAFLDIAQKIDTVDATNIPNLIELFQNWELLEAKEMLKVTEGRIKTIEKLESHIRQDALEVPTLHKFLKDFPWVIDPRWTLVSDETRYSDLLKSNFPEPIDTPDVDRRIDFLCVKESDTLIIIEIKRPSVKASKKEFDQILEYVSFIREYVEKTTDPEFKNKRVMAYLLVGSVTESSLNKTTRQVLANSDIYVRLYSDLLGMVKKLHEDFLQRYKQLQEVKNQAV